MTTARAQSLRGGTDSGSSGSLPFAATVLLGTLVFAMVRQGAYHQWQHQVFAVLVLGVGVLLGARRNTRSALIAACIIVLPVMASSLVSTALATDRSDARSTVLEIVLVAVGLAAGMTVDHTSREPAIRAVLLIATVVGATAIWGVATHSTPWGRITEGVWRGSSSLTYANAAAGVVGPVALLAFTQAALDGSRVYAASTTGLLIAFASTQSRAGAVALFVVGLVMIVVIGRRRFAETAIPILAGLAIGSPVLLARAGNDVAAQPVFAVAGVVAGLAVTAALWPVRTRIGRPEAVLAGLVGLAFAVSVVTGVLDSFTRRLTLRSGTTAQGENAGVLFGDRANEWSAAWKLVTEQPLLGHGPGVVDLRWIEDGRGFRAIFVHNEYLEFAVTNGVVGIAALAASGWLLARRLDRSRPVAGLVLACSAYLAHSAFDYLWHLPALPVFFAFIAGMALALPPES